jgi:maltose O-acetyltransferase
MNSMLAALSRRLRLVAYLYFARHLPEGPMPGGRLARRVRRWICVPLFASAGEDVNVERGAFFGDGSRISIGSRSNLGIDVRVHGPLTLGRDVMMGPRCAVYALGHGIGDVTVPMIDQEFVPARPVVVEDDVWIGYGTVILPGVRIGTGAVIGACSVVTRDVPPYAVAAGNPCVVRRFRTAKPDDGAS